jgi:hypothetical protein
MVLTSEGSDWYQSGMLPAERDEYMADWKAPGLV